MKPKEKAIRNNALTEKDISSNVVHKIPADLWEALTSDHKALAAWEDLTPLARNEWICWVISVTHLIISSIPPRKV